MRIIKIKRHIIHDGKVINIDDIDFSAPGEYNTMVDGDLSIHDVTKKIREKGTFTVTDKNIEGNAVFIVKPEDYNIKIPKTVISNIAEEIEVTVDVTLEAFQK